MYKRTLVPVVFDNQDGTAAALAAAKVLKGAEGTVTLLHVVEDIPAYVAGHFPEGLPAAARVTANEGLNRIASTAGYDVRTKVASGKASRSILDEAETIDADCIVIASHQLGLEDYLIGSTAARVVRHAKCAVHVVR